MSISSKLEELEIEAKIHSAFHETSRKLETQATANDINERNSKIQHTTCNTQPKPISQDKVSKNKQDKAAIPNGQYCTKCQGVKNIIVIAQIRRKSDEDLKKHLQIVRPREHAQDTRWKAMKEPLSLITISLTTKPPIRPPMTLNWETKTYVAPKKG